MDGPFPLPFLGEVQNILCVSLFNALIGILTLASLSLWSWSSPVHAVLITRTPPTLALFTHVHLLFHFLSKFHHHLDLNVFVFQFLRHSPIVTPTRHHRYLFVDPQFCKKIRHHWKWTQFMSFLILEVAPGNAVDVPGRQTGEMFSVLLLPWEPLVSKSILGEMNRNNRHNLESRPDVGE